MPGPRSISPTKAAKPIPKSRRAKRVASKPKRATKKRVVAKRATKKRVVAKRATKKRVVAKRRVEAKRRVAAMREQIADAKRRLTIPLPTFVTLAEVAEALHVSKPTAVRLVRRGELRSYRPNGFGGVVLVFADSLADHVERNSYGRAL